MIDPIVDAAGFMVEVLDGYYTEREVPVEGLIRLTGLLLNNMEDPLGVLNDIKESRMAHDESLHPRSAGGQWTNSDAARDEAGQVVIGYDEPDEDYFAALVAEGPPVEEPSHPDPLDEDSAGYDEEEYEDDFVEPYEDDFVSDGPWDEDELRSGNWTHDHTALRARYGL